MDRVHHSARSLNAAAVVIGLLTMGMWMCPVRAVEHSEDAVKAAYLYRFAGYVEWPVGGASEKPFVIAVVGAPGIARELRRLLPDHPIKGQIGQVREITGHRDLDDPQILYVAPGHTDLLRYLLPHAGGAAILLVTDEEGGLSAGGTLNFLTIDRNVRFEASLAAARRWGLKISSELLGVAIRVQRTGRPC